jgi:sulfur carrier protein ThiS adenylyltransferase
MNDVRQKLIYERLSKCRIGVAGLGGLGSNVVISLLRAGIGSFTLVDFDIVEENNLNRQYYFRDQIGKKKIDAIEENMRRIRSNVSVETHCNKLTPDTMTKFFQNVDIIVEALDDAEIKTRFIEEILLKLPEIPIIAASGVAGYGNSDRIMTRRIGKLYLCYDEYAKSSSEDVLLAPKVCLMANWQANIALEILLGDDYEYHSQ